MPHDFKDRFLALMAGKNRMPIRAEQPDAKVIEKTAVLRLYDPIDDYGGYWGTSAKEFATALDELPEDIETIELHINSPGGIVFEGVAILNLLRQHKARFVSVVDGVAASAASFLAAGADELVMAPNSELFVHRAWGFCVGNAEDMAQMAGELEHFDRNIASIYAKKAGGDVDEWLAAMSTETWYSAEEAVAAGLADRIDDAAPDATEAKNRVDLSIFKNSGRSPGQQQPVATHVGGPTQPPAEGGPAVAFSDEQLTDLRQMAGVADDADEATILDALKARAEAKPPETPEETKVPEGFELVPKGTGEQLTAASGRIEALEQKEHTRERDAFLAKWQRKFAPAARAEMEATYDKVGAEGLAALLEKSPDVLPLDQIGHGGNVDLDSEAARADADYERIYGKKEVSA